MVVRCPRAYADANNRDPKCVRIGFATRICDLRHWRPGRTRQHWPLTFTSLTGSRIESPFYLLGWPLVTPLKIHSDVIIDVSSSELWRAMDPHDKLRYQVVDLNAMLGSLPDDPLSAASLLVLGTSSLGHERCHEVIMRIRDTYPYLSVYVVGRRADRLAGRARGYAVAGAGDVFELDGDHDVTTFRQTVLLRLAAPPPRQLITDIHRLIRGSMVLSIVVDCLLESFRRRTVKTIEQRFGRYHKVINEQLRSSKLVAVGELLRAGRLAHAEELAARRRLTREETASILGYSSAKSLAAALQRAKRTGLYANGRFTVLRR